MITGKPLLTVEQIQNKVVELALRISEDYQGRALVAVCILKGAFMFFSDIVKRIEVPLKVDFIVVSSYVKTASSGEIDVVCNMNEDITGKDVLLIEDIADTGLTLDYLKEQLLLKNPASVSICTLLNKEERRKKDVRLDYVGFDIPDEYVVGYGLDYEGRFRNLPYIAICKEKNQKINEGN